MYVYMWYVKIVKVFTKIFKGIDEYMDTEVLCIDNIYDVCDSFLSFL